MIFPIYYTSSFFRKVTLNTSYSKDYPRQHGMTYLHMCLSTSKALFYLSCTIYICSISLHASSIKQKAMGMLGAPIHSQNFAKNGMIYHIPGHTRKVIPPLSDVAKEETCSQLSQLFFYFLHS